MIPLDYSFAEREARNQIFNKRREAFEAQYQARVDVWIETLVKYLENQDMLDSTKVTYTIDGSTYHEFDITIDSQTENYFKRVFEQALKYHYLNRLSFKYNDTTIEYTIKKITVDPPYETGYYYRMNSPKFLTPAECETIGKHDKDLSREFRIGNYVKYSSYKNPYPGYVPDAYYTRDPDARVYKIPTYSEAKCIVEFTVPNLVPPWIVIHDADRWIIRDNEQDRVRGGFRTLAHANELCELYFRVALYNEQLHAVRGRQFEKAVEYIHKNLEYINKRIEEIEKNEREP